MLKRHAGFRRTNDDPLHLAGSQDILLKDLKHQEERIIGTETSTMKPATQSKIRLEFHHASTNLRDTVLNRYAEH